MSVLLKIFVLFVTLAVTVVPALAVTDSRNLPTYFLVWGFLGCCALIIVTQIVPMILEFRKQSKLAAAQKKLPEQHRP